MKRCYPSRFMPSSQILFICFIVLVYLSNDLHWNTVVSIHTLTYSSILIVKYRQCIQAIFVEHTIWVWWVCSSVNSMIFLVIYHLHWLLMLLLKNLMQFSLAKTTVLDLSTNVLIQWSLPACERPKLFAKCAPLLSILLLKQGVSIRSCLRSSFVVFEVFDSTWMRIFILICLPDSIMIVYIIKVSFVVPCMQCLFGLSLLTVFILLDCNWSERI